MTDLSSLYAFYADATTPPASTEYWQQRRQFAKHIRALQTLVQTTEFNAQQLAELNQQLSQLTDSLPKEPRLEGRKAWIESGRYGDFGTIHTEITSVIGPSNPITPGLCIWFEADKAYGHVTFSWMYEGNAGIAHGGWIAAVFDEFLGTAQVLSGKTGMTGTLTVNYHKPTPLNQELKLVAWLDHNEGRKAIVKAEMWAGDIKTASCDGLFIVPASQEAPILGG